MNDRRDTSMTRTAPPHDLAAERAVLGAILLKPALMAELGTMLEATHFYDPRHRVIYAAINELDSANERVDQILVMRKLHAMGLAEEAGGLAYVGELMGAVPTTVNSREYARIVTERATLRETLAFAERTAHAVGGEIEDVPAFLDTIAREALQLSVRGANSSVVSLGHALKHAFEAAEKRSKSSLKGQITGVPSGFHRLDKLTSGWQPSDLIILAARPGMGKTAFALNMLLNAAQDRRVPTPGVIFSLEMSTIQLATRLWCSNARVPMERLRSGELGVEDWDRLCRSMERLIESPIFIDDTPAISITEMMRKCRQLRHEHRIGVIMVDYLQLMTVAEASKRASREQVISEISRSLKALAKELNVPVIALSQLNRSVESRPDKRPMLSDLRESGAIEQDADIITFLYREAYYESMKGGAPGSEGEGNTERRPNDGPSLTEVIMAKHRSGSTGKVELSFHAPFTLFTNLEDGPPPPEDQLARPGDFAARVDHPGYAEPEPQPDEGDDFPSAAAGDVDDDLPY